MHASMWTMMLSGADRGIEDDTWANIVKKTTVKPLIEVGDPIITSDISYFSTPPPPLFGAKFYKKIQFFRSPSASRPAWWPRHGPAARAPGRPAGWRTAAAKIENF